MIPKVHDCDVMLQWNEAPTGLADTEHLLFLALSRSGMFLISGSCLYHLYSGLRLAACKNGSVWDLGPLARWSQSMSRTGACCLGS
jgi:hypothetical protein